MIDLGTLNCEQVEVTPQDQGETLARFAVRPGDVLMADRGLAHRRGFRHVVSHGGDVVVQMNLVSVPLEDAQGQALDRLPWLRHFRIGEPQALEVFMRDSKGPLALRICAIKKSAEKMDSPAHAVRGRRARRSVPSRSR